ncbi:septal ring lytic transglycosylase RlpA family protein [Legionella yabuuchiae]|uniref:septal ring lytic transglycosylase RlpA family protein n=1 Tax=Legionella yabuuchiae TaxID=376727 RepID=UPI00105593AD|nr:septal ring lytic transglycosylase RlpA family protein [Legionella yabuuchiae]
MRLIFLLILSFLASCQSKNVDHKHSITPEHKKDQQYSKKNRYEITPTEQDGAPNGPHPKRFKSVTPVPEITSRYGNPGEYRVNGKVYEVMRTASGYRARGLASWYGTKFHSKRTSSGEPYDLYSMTAAHKTLPLPTYVKVTNLENHREAIVKVNDRGPFHEGRIIDLSYGAALKLGLLPKGTAQVEVVALTPKNTPQQELHYFLQAGAFTKPEQAKKLLASIAKLTPSRLFIEQYNQYYIVKAGPFTDKKHSDALKVTLAKHGIGGAFSVLQ